MKKVLITGAESYIGTSVEKWLLDSADAYQVDTLDVRDDKWSHHDFSVYDTVFHVAGIAHFSKDESKRDLYYAVNTKLTEKVARLAKEAGVSQFIFMSSIIVYGDSTAAERVITRATEPSPSDFYGDSKLKAEQALQKLADNRFKVAILRPPMIYGKGSKGNYPRLAKLAVRVPVFPKITNQRSMLHIDNLCAFIEGVIKENLSGLYFPQNREYVSTSELVYTIAKVHGKTVKLTSLLNPLISLLFELDTIKKMFGNLVYEKSMSQYDFDYQVRDFEETVQATEKYETKE